MKREPGRLRRSVLFVPAAQPDRYLKALATGADVVCIDLEDGVREDVKAHARQAAVRLLAARESGQSEVWLRINAPHTELGRLDLEALSGNGPQPDGLVVPKVSRADDIRTLEAALTGTLQGVPIIPIIETAKAMVEGEAIAATSIGVSAIIFGAIDYSTDVGCATEWDALLYARSRVVLAASAADIDAVDGPFMEVERLDFLKAECRDVARLGFAGKVAIHPTQVDIIHECFTPTPETVARALRVIAAYEAGGSGPLLVDGTLIERPVIERAKRTLHIAQLSKKAGQPG